MAANISDLFPALVECFAIILCGYISGRMNILTPNQGTGLGKFVGSFALPALLFKNMVELDFSTVTWFFMVAVLLAKTTVFAIVLLFSVILLKSRRLARGSLYAIFSTQSNDFALGYPLISALYGDTRPEFIQYIYLFAPISLLILNPIGFIILEIDKTQHSDSREYMLIKDMSLEENKVHIGECIDVVDEDEPEDSPLHNADNVVNRGGFTWQSCKSVLKGVLLNPLVFMVFIGVAGHFIFHGKLPAIIGNTLGTLAEAFAGAALFFLGLSMVGKISKQRGMELLIPSLLIIMKVLILPLIIRQYCILLSHVMPQYPAFVQANTTNVTDYVRSLSDFGYLYGTFPSAPTVAIYASQYGLEIDRLAAGMVLCTSLSAPAMYISAWTLSMGTMSSEYFQEQVTVVGKDTSILTLLCSVWCVVIFVIGGKFKRVPHAVTLAYMFSLVISSLGTIFWDGLAAHTTQSGKLFIFGMMYFGVKCSRLYAASIALTVVMVLWKGQRAVWNHCFAFIIVPIVISFIATAALMATNPMGDTREDAVFLYGKAQDVASFIILIFSIVVNIACLVAIAKLHEHHDDTLSPSSSLLQRAVSASEFSSDEDASPRGKHLTLFCCVRRRCVRNDIQKGRHIALLILLTLSIFLGICLTGWRLFGSPDVGIYYEIAFLDSVFNFGQGVFIFLLFGLDSDLIIDPFIRLYRRIRFGTESISLPELNSLPKHVLLQCLQFIRHHLNDFKLDIVAIRTSNLVSYDNVFTGSAFCDWIIDRGLVMDRTEAEIYGQNLLNGRILYHVTQRHYFYDRNYLYKFEEPKTCHKMRNDASMSAGSSDLSDSEGTSRGATSSNMNIASPPRTRPYFGYSFEAYLTDSDMPTSLRKQRDNNDATPSDGYLKNRLGAASTDRTSRKGNWKKMFPRDVNRSVLSDSSID